MAELLSTLDSRKIGIESSGTVSSLRRWETVAEQRIYSSKLIDALRRLRRGESKAISTQRDVRDTADRVLALSARGRTRWSRAILNRRRRRSFGRTHKKAGRPTAAVSRPNRPPCRPFQRRINVLSRLIPGCRKASPLSLLEETTDYISALQMQVKAMTSLAAATAQINAAT